MDPDVDKDQITNGGLSLKSGLRRLPEYILGLYLLRQVYGVYATPD